MLRRSGFLPRSWSARVACVLLALTAVAATGGAASAAQPRQVYVALGDSFAAGPLIPWMSDLGCARSDHNYPHMLAAKLGVDELRDVTCDSAGTEHMTRPQARAPLGIQMGDAPPQFDALGPDTTLVTVTLGGNDTGLVGIAQDCMTWNANAVPCKQRWFPGGVDLVGGRIAEFEAKMKTVLREIHVRAPKARVVATGYGLYLQPGGCFPAQPFLPEDADFLQDSVNRMNDAIAAAAAAEDARYIDLAGPSAGHDSCQSPRDKWIEGAIPVNFAAPLHPNQLGEEQFADFIAAQLVPRHAGSGR